MAESTTHHLTRENSGGGRVLTPKQLEIRNRGTRILDAAFPLVREHGLSAVSMESIARAMDCTRGTIYNHFSNKEDILLALAARSVRRRMELFRYAVTLGQDSRQCCAAIGIAAEVYVDCLPDDFSIEQITRHDPVWQKTSQARRKVLAECEQQCIDCISGVISSAIRNGDLVVAKSVTQETLVQRIVFGLWSLVYGGLVLESTSPSLGMAGISQPRVAIRRNCNALLDDIGWRPLFDPSAYQKYVSSITPKLRRQAKSIQKRTSQEVSA
ncbi:TetR/AcrR family transcriptional regulator [Aporhodopirellula aestuarii]|uniref:TetR/AcrR family transcriptional regulator n=1 Tax=Aporhodopirellula aestuarii TaxID=2950107 RepID=A0ABT0U970_9BACT|nr:TetR/AcrR family transcriptional regulator [Aporhodopirellula aestuarii]MCM2373470.1 TetR/AcrR family transcriptional regulator [Aporhodopirellula aestuarii]